MNLPTLLLVACAAGAAGAADDAPTRGPYLVEAGSTSWRACWAFARTEECAQGAGLAPGSAFEYRISGTTIAVSGRLLPPLGEPLRFAALGAMGNGGPAQRRVALELERSRPQLVLALGDIVHPAGEDADYDAKYFSVYGALLPNTPFFPVPGEQDYGDTRSLERGLRRFEDYRRIHGRPAYYSFDAGPVHFAVIDTNYALGVQAAESFEPNSPQWRWLDADLEAARAPWKVVVTHAALYGSRGEGDERALRAALEPVFRRRDVRLVIQGHPRFYERSRPIGGVVYVTAGTGGLLIQGGRRRDWVESRAEAHGFIEAEAEAGRLVLRFVDATGAERDELELKK